MVMHGGAIGDQKAMITPNCSVALEPLDLSGADGHIPAMNTPPPIGPKSRR